MVISLSRILQWRGRELRNLKSLLMKIGDESILVFSLKILSRSSLHFVGIRVFILEYVKIGRAHV